MEYRLDNENLLAEKAWQRPGFGWSGWDRSRIRDENDKVVTVADSMWIIAFGTYGAVGLIALLSVMFLPIVALRFRIPPTLWNHPVASQPVLMALILALWLMDSVLQCDVEPDFYPDCGGAGRPGAVCACRRSRRRCWRELRRGPVRATARHPRRWQTGAVRQSGGRQARMDDGWSGEERALPSGRGSHRREISRAPFSRRRSLC